MNSTLSIVPKFTGKIADWLVPDYFKPVPVKPSMTEQLTSIAARCSFIVVDALDRIRQLTDGMDKSLKLAVAAAVGMILVPGVQVSFWSALSKDLKRVDGVLSAVSVFGRINEFTRRDRDTGAPAFLKVGPIKNAAVGILALAKSFEFCRLLQTVGLLSNAALTRFDTRFLGGVCANIGRTTVLGNAAYQAGLGGCKNFFLTISSSFSVLHNMIVLINWKDANTDKGSVALQRAGLSIGADMGKIYLAVAAFTITVTWVAIAALTAIFSLAKILLDSYEKKPLQYPSWMMTKV